MKAVQFRRFGEASEVAELVDIEEPALPGPGEVTVEVVAAPINPSDLLHFSGRYGEPPALPSFAGGGVLVTVLHTGAGIDHVAPGDRAVVVSGRRKAWRERFVCSGADAIALPDGDPVQSSLLAANPPTALLMLENFLDHEPGAWVIQNAANSSVGVSLIQLARIKGLRTINVVRRDSAVDALARFGADVVLVDGADLPERVREATKGEPVRLAIDAVAGAATARLAACVSERGNVVNYGLMSGEACQIASADVLFRDVALRGFWYTRWLAEAPRQAVADLFARLVAWSRSGALQVPVEGVYPITRLHEALRHAERPGRTGKVVLLWGPES